MRITAARSDAKAASRKLWEGLRQFNLDKAGPFRYQRVVLCARQGLGAKLLEEAERRARRRGSRVIHLSTYSFQAPGFYESQGYRRFGLISGSPRGHRRYFYVKRLKRAGSAAGR